IFVRVGIRVAAHFRQSVERVLGLAVVRQRAIAFMDLLELAYRVRTMPRMPPHFLALHEKGVPVVDARVYSQQPASWFVGRLRHPSKSVGRTIHGRREKLRTLWWEFCGRCQRG